MTSGASVQLISMEAGQFILPPSCLLSRELIVPSSSHSSSSCNLQSTCRFFFFFFYFVNLPSKNHQDCGQMASLLRLTPQSVLSQQNFTNVQPSNQRALLPPAAELLPPLGCRRELQTPSVCIKFSVKGKRREAEEGGAGPNICL